MRLKITLKLNKEGIGTYYEKLDVSLYEINSTILEWQCMDELDRDLTICEYLDDKYYYFVAVLQQ